MVSDRPLQDVDSAWPAFVVVNRAEDAARLDGHQTHSQLATCHARDLGAKVNRRKQLHTDAFRLGCILFAAHRNLLCISKAYLLSGGKSAAMRPDIKAR
jgi:hypothetical protein